MDYGDAVNGLPDVAAMVAVASVRYGVLDFQLDTLAADTSFSVYDSSWVSEKVPCMQ